MKKIICLFFILIAILLAISTKSNAAGSISLSPSSSNIQVGDTVHIQINLSGASVATLTTRLTVDTSKFQYISGPSNSSFNNGRAIYTWTDPTGGSNPKTGGTLATFTFKAIAPGSANFSISGDFYDPDENPIKPSFSGTTVNIQTPTTQEPPPTTTPTPNPEPTPTPTPPTGNEGNNNPSGGSNNSGSNNQNPSTGGNTNLSTNANLKSLHLSQEGISPAFSKKTTNYQLTVLDTVSDIQVTAEPEDSKASVAIIGNTNLVTGLNKIVIAVTAQDGKTKKNYAIQVTKTQDLQAANANLENLAIENVNLIPEFQADITQYTASVGSDIENLHLLAVAQMEEAKVDITGNENLQPGDNTITITVTAKDGITQKVYTIAVHKKTQQEEEEERLSAELQEKNKENRANLKQDQENATIGKIAFSIIITIGVVAISAVLIIKYIQDKKEMI